MFKTFHPKFYVLFLLQIIFLTNSIYSSDSTAVIRTDSSATIAGEDTLFYWEGIDKLDIDPKITFWDYNSSPLLDKNFIEGSWNYLNEQSRLTSSTVNKEGQIKIKAPKKEGLYKIYYCYFRFGEFKCDYIRTLAVITCTKDLNKIKKILKKPENFTNKNNSTKSSQNKNSTKNKKKLSQSNIEHIIIFISENHSFDSIYGNYCKAETHSNPTCNLGPECCEAAPEKLHGIKPYTLSDTQNARYGPCHQSDCENSEINGGKMNKYLINGVGSHPYNFAVAKDDIFSAKNYFKFAKEGAIADNFFQSSAGASCQNNMFFAAAKFVFLDNVSIPQSRQINGAKCFKEGSDKFNSYYDPTIADVLNVCNITWTFYAEGFNEKPNSDQCYPYYYDASDDPFTYFPSLTEYKTSEYNFRDYTDLINDIKNKTLPSVSYIKGLGIHSEHPEYPGSFLTGQMLSNQVYETVMNSEYYRNNTLIILLPDESGGFYDHKSPPPINKIDGNQYGPRTQFVALGDMVKKNYISHVLMEPSSIIRFIEWNWVGNEGILQARDLLVNNIGDIIDNEKAGVQVPSLNNLSIEDIEKKNSNIKNEISKNKKIKSSLFFRKNGKKYNELDGLESDYAQNNIYDKEGGVVKVGNNNLRKRFKFTNSRIKRFEDW